MRALAGTAERGPIVSVGALLGALTVLVLTVFTGYRTLDVTIVVAIVVAVIVAHRYALRWDILLAVLVVVILVVPIRRYALPGGLPFELEPYRVLVAVIIAGWLSSLLIDPRVRLRYSGFEGPIFLITFALLCSVVVNDERIRTLGVEPDVVKKLMFFMTFVLILYFVVSTIGARGGIDLLVRVLVAGGAGIALLAVVESRTNYNLFNHLSQVFPLLEPHDVGDPITRGSRFRAYGPAQHPIALAAALVMLVPLGIYLARSSARRWWWLAVVALGMGALATVSRTSILMLLTVGAVFLWLRPAETRRLGPALLPALIIVYFALPGTISSLKESFFPAGGLIEQQSQNPGWRGSGRLADIGPSLDEFSKRPLLGGGYGTRVTEAGRENSPILDNQWLGNLLEVGLLGTFGWVWLFYRFIRRTAREARADLTHRGWLLTALCASATAFAVGMVTHDAFAFVQEVFLFFILLALGAVALSLDAEREVTRGRRRRPAQ